MADVQGSTGSTEWHGQGLDPRTARTFMRWSALQRIVPFVVCALGAVGVAWQLHGTHTSVNIELGVAFSVTIPAGLIKIFWDRRQKMRQRARMRRYEQTNRQLALEVARLEGRLSETRRQLEQ